MLPRAPPPLAEHAVYVTVAMLNMLYLGLASGATVSWLVGTHAMDLSGMQCPSPS